MDNTRDTLTLDRQQPRYLNVGMRYIVISEKQYSYHTTHMQWEKLKGDKIF